MKCTKCGYEYEGNSCPKCSGPEILVNNEDYMQRKREWEEKQAIESASLKHPDKIENSLAELAKITKEKTLEKKEKAVTHIKKSKEKIKTSSNGTGTEHDRTVSTDSLKRKENSRKSSKRRRKKTVLLIVALAGILAVSFGLYGLMNRKNKTLYVLSEERIYDISKLENELVCTEDKAIFTSDQKMFFQPEIPNDLTGKTVIQSMASSDGKFFSSVVYEESSGEYSMYLWNNNSCLLASQSKNEKSIKYISDKGKVLFTDTAILYEGAVSSIGLYTFDFSEKSETEGKTTIVNENIRSVYLYLKQNILVYLTSGNVLYTADLNNLSDKKMAAENVKDIYGPSSDTEDIYSNSSGVIKNQNIGLSLIYSLGGEYYYTELNSKEPVFLFKSILAGVDIVYEKKSGYVYCINIGSISSVKLTDENSGLSKIDDMKNSSGAVYLDKKNTLLYINSQGSLMALSKGNATVIRENVAQGSLSVLENSDGAITYIAGNVQYYKSSLTASEMKMQDLSEGNSTEGTVVYKNNLYFLNDTDELYSCTVKGKGLNKWGNVTRFWVE